jgi:hypothetical protein
MAGSPHKFNIDMQSSKGTVVGDYNTIYQQYLGGITSLPTNYDTRISNFLADYLDSPGQQVPFGGRKDDIERLDAWLDDPQATPYLLLAAPAGRGKSALLVRWSRRLLERSDLRVAFVPVSIRYSINLSTVLFSSLAARLAEIYDEPVPTDANTPADVWQGIVSDYLSRTPAEGWSLVVIVDGIDEAADWQAGPDLFPVWPPKGLRIVVSARYTATAPDASSWLSLLGWDRLQMATAVDLQPLSPEGVADVLAHMEGPVQHLGGNSELAATLHHLSGGDPLLVQLFVKDLHARGESVMNLRPEDLKDIPSGLEGYFKRWWSDQKKLWGSDAPLKEADVQLLLNLLSCAMGPLSQLDLMELEPRLNSYTLEAALKPIERFVAGDGKRQGYVFSHSRLADYFREQRLSPPERREVYKRYLDWGERTLSQLRERERTPETVSPYLVQYYLAHLKSAGATPQTLLAVVTDEWRLSWESYEGTYAGFLNDVITVRRLLETFNAKQAVVSGTAPYVWGEVRCALVQASINSLAGNIPPKLIEALVGVGIWTPPQGIAYALQIRDRERAAAGLVALLPHLAPGQRSEYLGRALTLLRSIASPQDKARAYQSILPKVAEHGYVDEALAATDDAPYTDTRLWVLARMGEFIPESSREEMFFAPLLDVWHACAKAYVRKEQEEMRWSATLLAALSSNLSGELAEDAARQALEVAFESVSSGELIAKAARYLPDKLLRKALAKSRGISRLEERAQALAAIAPRLHSPLREEAIFEAFAASLAASKTTTFGDSFPLYEGVVALAAELPAEIAPDLLRAIAQVENEYWRAAILAGVAPLLPQHSHTDALSLVDQMTHNLSRGIALAGLVPQLPASLKEKMLREMMAAASATTDEYLFVECLRKVRDNLTDAIRREALEVILSFDQEAQSEGAAVIVSSLAAEGRHEEALAIAGEMQSPQARAHALLALLEAGPPEPLRRDATEQVLAALNTIDDEELRRVILASLMPHLPEALLQPALDLACSLKDEIIRSRSLLEIAPHLTASQHEQLINCSREITDEYLLARTLADLTPHVGKHFRQTLVEEALKLAEAMEDEEDFKRLRSHAALTAARAGLVEQAELLASQMDENRAQVYVALTPHMDEQGLREMFALLPTLEYSTDQASLFRALVEHLPESLLPEARATTRELSFGLDNSGVAAAFVERLIELKQFELALEELEKIDDFWGLTLPLEKLAPHLSQPLLRRAVNVVLRYGGAPTTANTLAVLVPYLDDELLQRLLEVVKEFNDDDYARLRSLVVLLPHLPESTRGDVVRDIHACLNSVETDWVRQLILKALAPHLPEQEKLEVLREVLAHTIASGQEAQDEHHGFWSLTSLAPHLPEDILTEALALVQSHKKGWKDHTLAALAVRQAELGQPEEAVKTLSLVDSERLRIETKAAIAPQMSKDRAKELLSEALEDARGVDDAFDQIRARAKLLQHLPEQARREVQEQLYGLAVLINEAALKAKALAWLAPHLEEPTRGEALEQALAAARTLPDEEESRMRSTLLMDVVKAMAEGGYYERALAVLPDISYGWSRRETLVHLPGKLPQPLLDRALEDTRAGQFEMEEWRAEVLVAFALRYEEPRRSEIFIEALEAAEHATYTVNVANGVLPRMAPHLSEDLLHKAFQMAQRTRTSEHLKGTLLACLAPHLPKPLLRDALATMRSFTKLEDQKNQLNSFIVRLAALGHVEEAMTLTETLSNHSYEFAHALGGMAPFLQGELFEKAFRMAQGMSDDWQKETALEGLIPYVPERLHDDLLATVIELESSRKVKGLAACVPHFKGDRQVKVINEFLQNTRTELDNSYGQDFIDDSISRVVPYLPEALLPAAFELALMRKNDDQTDFKALAERLAQIPLPRRYEVWREILQLLATHPRNKLLHSVEHFGPVLSDFGSPAAVEEVMKAISEVGRWWP